MQILYICSDPGIPVLGRKGAAIHVRSLAAAFTRAGHAVIVAAPVLLRSPWESPAALDAQMMHIPVDDHAIATLDIVRGYTDALGVPDTLPRELRRLLYNQSLAARLRRRFKDAAPDFVYERAAVFSTAGACVARALGVPLVVELNAPLSLEQATYRGAELSDIASRAERHTLSAADLVVTVSAPLREYAIEQGARPDRTVTMPNGVDTAVFSPGPATDEVRRRWGIGDGPVLGFVGGLRPWHGVRAFVPLLERLVDRLPNVQLVIAGDGPLKGELTSAFAARGLDRHVIVTGAVGHDQIPDLLRTFDVALAPYEETPHLFYFSPLKLFEYMACGLPVVAAALGQIGDVIHDDENGCLYRAGDIDSLVGACAGLLGDARRRQRIGQAAVQTIRRGFTWDGNARRVVELMAPTRQPQGVTA